MQSRPSNHAPSSPSLKSKPLSRSKTSPAATVSQKHAFEPQLSERDSIFATNYNTLDVDSPVNTPSQPRPSGSRDGEGPLHYLQPKDSITTNNGDGADGDQAMAVSPHRSMTDLSRSFHVDPHPNVDAFRFYDKALFKTVTTPIRSDTLSQQPVPTIQQRPQQSLPTQSLPYKSPDAVSNTISTSRPTTPRTNSDPQLRNLDDVQSSVERSQYRSWREGKGKMSGKTIAESQGRKNSAEAATDVDRKIDAKLPKHEQGVNVRSRKTSHYLGLFKDDEAEKKRADEKDKDKAKDGAHHAELASIKEARGDSVIGE